MGKPRRGQKKQKKLNAQKKKETKMPNLNLSKIKKAIAASSESWTDECCIEEENTWMELWEQVWPNGCNLEEGKWEHMWKTFPHYHESDNSDSNSEDGGWEIVTSKKKRKAGRKRNQKRSL